jgi:hypothetical protein
MKNIFGTNNHDFQAPHQPRKPPPPAAGGKGERIEYKAGWNPDAILRMLCAFADSAGGSLKISMKSLIVTPLFLSNIILVTLHNFMLLRSR